MSQMHMPPEITRLADRGALFVINSSGGKDSQAMTIALAQRLPRDQLVIVHADLGAVEWEGCLDHIKATGFNLPVRVTRNPNKDFLSMVEQRGMFPSPTTRQCTSDLKRGPIEREVRHYLKANPRFGGLVVNCMGMRAEESSSRSKLTPFKKNERNSIAGREWHDWLPIHDWTIDQVWEAIAGAGQQPHPAYGLGMSRLSCRFCVMSSDRDLTIAAQNSPELYARYVALEKQIGHTMMMPRGGVARGLEEITGIPVQEMEPG